MSAVRPKGLGETRTAIGTQVRATPPQNRSGQSLLDSYVLSRELKRLGQQLVPLDRQRDRIAGRMVEIRQEMARLATVFGDARSAVEPPVRQAAQKPSSADAPEASDRVMKIGY